jgi:toxin-antitoxin system PIN domain toxin
MNSLIFPDLNVWLAIAAPEHVHATLARHWWEQAGESIAFCRLTQMGLLRLVTTAAAMKGKPLTMAQAWLVYDRFFDDERVQFVNDPPSAEQYFRERSNHGTPSPKIWADAWLLAVAQSMGGVVVTLDRALSPRGARCLLPNG